LLVSPLSPRPPMPLPRLPINLLFLTTTRFTAEQK
jgi:hypothetical protein